MRILLLIRRLEVGGAERHVVELANELARRSHTVHVMGGSGILAAYLHPAIYYRKRPLPEITILLHLLYLRRYIRRYQIDLIHAHQRFPIFLACLAGVLTGVPVVATVHGRPRYDLRSSFARNHLSGIAFVSRHVLEVSSLEERHKRRSVVIPNGTVLQPRVSTENQGWISYVSRIDSKHGQLLTMLMEQVLPVLCRDYPLIRLFIFGHGKRSTQVTAAVKKANRKAGRELCTFMGPVQSHTKELHQSSLVLGVGRAAIEALSMGIPVLLVNHHHLGGIPVRENFDHLRAVNFLEVSAPPPNPLALKAALVNFLERPDYWKAECQHIATLVHKYLLWENVVPQVETLYLQAMGHRSTPSGMGTESLPAPRKTNQLFPQDL